MKLTDHFDEPLGSILLRAAYFVLGFAVAAVVL